MVTLAMLVALATPASATSAVPFLELWYPAAAPGRTAALTAAIERQLPVGLVRRRDAFGSLIVMREDASPTRVLAVGIDETSYVVSRIRPDGYLRLRLVGAGGSRWHEHHEGRPVRVHTRDGKQLPGVIVVDNVHLRAPRPDPVTERHLFVDIGADSPEQVHAMGVRLLDVVTARELVAMENAVAGVGVGQRALIVAALAAIRARGADGFPEDLAVAFVAQSRVGRPPLGRAWEGVLHSLGPARATVLSLGAETQREAVRVRDASRGRPETASLYLRVAHRRTPVEKVTFADVKTFADAVAKRVFSLEAASAIAWPAHRFYGQPQDVASHGHEDAVLALAGLTTVQSVSGHEEGVRKTLSFFLGRILQGRVRPDVDAAGNMTVTVGTGERTILFVAHMDEVGFVVQRIEDDGRLLMRRRGGLYAHLYGHSAMELLTPKGVLPGISILQSAGRMYLDIGASSKEDAIARGVATGQPATVPKEFLRLGAHRATGRSFDDRVGCAAMINALRSIDFDKLDRKVVFAWVTREEIGLEGAEALAEAMKPSPEIVFPVDTFVSTDSPRDDKRYAYTRIGEGAVLRAIDSSSITPLNALDRVRQIAEKHGIPLQIGTVDGGNDGSRFVPRGTLDCPLSWPQRCSHSRVETMDLRDLESLTELIVRVATEY